MDNKIIEKIKNSQIKMKPKWRFALKSFLLVVLSLLLLFLLLFLVSFILRFGLFISFRVFPWMILLFVIGFVVLLEFLISRYAAAYRRPVIYSVIAIIVIIFLAGGVMNMLRFHEMIERRNLPMIRRMYDGPTIHPIMHPMMQPIRKNIKFEINGRERL